MPKSRRPYAPEFRRQMVDLVRSGRTPEALSREFEPTDQAICNWCGQADRDEGRRQDGATSAEREELTRLRHENRRLRQERYLGKGSGLVRTGNRSDPVRVFQFMSANTYQRLPTARPQLPGPYIWASSTPKDGFSVAGGAVNAIA